MFGYFLILMLGLSLLMGLLGVLVFVVLVFVWGIFLLGRRD